MKPSMPPAGSHCQRPATNSTSTMATQKVGKDWPSTDDHLRGPVEPRALLHRGENSQGEGDRQGYPHGEGAEPEGVGQPLLDQLHHGPAGADRRPEIARHRLAEEREVLLDVRPVESEVLPGVGIVLLGRRHGEDQMQGIAGGPGQDEHHHGQDGQRRQRLQQPGQNEANHVRARINLARRGSGAGGGGHARGECCTEQASVPPAPGAAPRALAYLRSTPARRCRGRT